MMSYGGVVTAISIMLAIALWIFRSQPLRTWLWPKMVGAHRVVSVLGYLLPFVFMSTIFWSPTKKNAVFFKRLCLLMWIPASAAFYLASWQGLVASSWHGGLFKHFLWLYVVDIPMLVCVTAASSLDYLFSRKSENRLFGEKPDFHGKRIVVLGNGPSLVKGDPCGDLIDSMDEVVRFNNFQTKTSGLEKWTGNKTTVHFSDSMLYPSYPEYHVPGATVTLSLFMDRLMVAGSYFIFRIGVDLAIKETFQMLLAPSLGWVPHEDINQLKEELGIDRPKHPTSGCLAIDWFVRNRPDPSVPVYIHGFDFFEGPEIHYYNKTEPLYERINDMIGVTTMHQPEKEKSFVARLVKEGKVKWLKDVKAKRRPSTGGA
jgi:hypothetical protein